MRIFIKNIITTIIAMLAAKGVATMVNIDCKGVSILSKEYFSYLGIFILLLLIIDGIFFLLKKKFKVLERYQ
ncbi:MAG: hypothetical protein ACOCRK_07330 [bacterium]